MQEAQSVGAHAAAAESINATHQVKYIPVASVFISGAIDGWKKKKKHTGDF